MTRDKNYGKSELHVDLGPQREKLIPYAEDVAIARGAQVAEALFHMAAIRNLQRTPTTGSLARVECVAAKVQDVGAQHGQQAAHLLPGQIQVNGRVVWSLVPATASEPQLAHALLRLSQQTQLCFAKTSVLPAEFNRADSAAEGTGQEVTTRGLKQMFGDVVQQLWTSARIDEVHLLAVDRRAVLGALESWFTQVNAVYEAAARRKLDAAAEARRQRDPKAQNREEEATILQTYARSFKVANPGRFVSAHVHHIEGRYRELW